jgi:membrane associated rhomboid family serine protease
MPFQQRTLRFGPAQGLSPVVRRLLIVNVVMYIAQLAAGSFLMEHFALHPNQIITEWKIWQLLSYMFLHGSFFHLFFNMFTLWMFGCEVERTLGSSYFLKYYLLTGASGGLLQIALNWGDQAAIIGASPAIYGVLVAFAVLFPERPITLLLFFVLPVHLKAKTLALIFVGISLILGLQNQLFGSSDAVAHFAHLGGAAAGFSILRGSFYFKFIKQKLVDSRNHHREEQERLRRDKLSRVRRQIDEVLDRINKVGYENISPAEKEFLKKAGELLAKEDD